MGVHLETNQQGWSTVIYLLLTSPATVRGHCVVVYANLVLWLLVDLVAKGELLQKRGRLQVYWTSGDFLGNFEKMKRKSIKGG